MTRIAVAAAACGRVLPLPWHALHPHEPPYTPGAIFRLALAAHPAFVAPHGPLQLVPWSGRIATSPAGFGAARAVQ